MEDERIYIVNLYHQREDHIRKMFGGYFSGDNLSEE